MGQIGCAIEQPTALPDSGWAAPRVVYARLSAFVLDRSVMPPVTSGLPVRTTRAWARETVVQLFDSAAAGEAPAGLTRAVAHLHPLAYDAASAAQHQEWAAPWAAQLAPATAVLGNLFQSPDDGRGRAGILTDTAALTAKPSISGRGEWLSRALFCQLIPPPPLDLPSEVEQSTGTRRQALEAAVRNPVCAGCHFLMDPPGYSLEHFDEEGAHRTRDNGLPIDSNGRIDQLGLEFTDITDLAPQLAISCEVAHCFARQVFNDAAAAAGVEPPTELEINRTTKAFVDSGFSIRALVRAIAESPTLLR